MKKILIDGLYYNLDEENKTAEVTSAPNGGLASYSNLTSLSIPKSVIYNSETYCVTSIDKKAFSFCSELTSINIPNSVECIGNGAFSYCDNLTSIVIPDSVISIGVGAFEGCFLDVIKMSQSNSKYDSRDDCNAIIETATNRLITGGASTIIPNSVKRIGWGAFCGCWLDSIEIPDGVKRIGDYAFSVCPELTSVVIPDSVSRIDSHAFDNCKRLKSVVISNGVNKIGDCAFSDCDALTSITCEAVVPPVLGSDVFKGVKKSIPLYVPSESIAAYQAANQWNEFETIQPPI